MLDIGTGGICVYILPGWFTVFIVKIDLASKV